MTEITTLTDPAARADDDDAGLHPSEILLNLIVTFLAPMFLCASRGDILLARMAALETVNGYRARSHADLVSIAQIIAFGLAAMGSLSLSMADDLSVSMMLRLRGNANACNRSAEQNRRCLLEAHANPAPVRNAEARARPEDDVNEAAVVAGVAAARQRSEQIRDGMRGARPATEPAHTTPPAPAVSPVPAVVQPTPAVQPAPAVPPAPAVQPAPAPAPPAATSVSATLVAPPRPGALMTPEQERQAMWGAAAADVAAEITASLPTLPPAERRVAAMRAAALTEGANDLMSGSAPVRRRPGDRDGLMDPASV